MRNWTAALVFLPFGVLACSRQPPQPEFTAEDEAAIHAVFDQYETNWVGDQFMASLDLYTDDARELLLNVREGKEEIRTRWEGFVNSYEFTRAEIDVGEIIGFGDYAYASVNAQAWYL